MYILSLSQHTATRKHIMFIRDKFFELRFFQEVNSCEEIYFLDVYNEVFFNFSNLLIRYFFLG